MLNPPYRRSKVSRLCRRKLANDIFVRNFKRMRAYLSRTSGLALQTSPAVCILAPRASAAFRGENRAPKRFLTHRLARLLFRAFHELTYRQTEAFPQEREDPFPSHPSLARYAPHPLERSLLMDPLQRLARELAAHLSHQDPDPPFTPWTPPA